MTLAVAVDFGADPFVATRRDGPCTTRLWPGKISARFSPFARISAAVVVWYFLAIAPSVSPDFTTCIVECELPYRSIAGSGTAIDAATTAAVGTRTTCPGTRFPLFSRLSFGL